MEFDKLLQVYDLRMINDSNGISFVTTEGEKLKATKIENIGGRFCETYEVTHLIDITGLSRIKLEGINKLYTLELNYDSANNTFKLIHLSLTDNEMESYISLVNDGLICINSNTINVSSVNGFSLDERNNKWTDVFYVEDKYDEDKRDYFDCFFGENGKYSKSSYNETTIGFDYICETNERVRKFMELTHPELLSRALEVPVNDNEQKRSMR